MAFHSFSLLTCGLSRDTHNFITLLGGTCASQADISQLTITMLISFGPNLSINTQKYQILYYTCISIILNTNLHFSFGEISWVMKNNSKTKFRMAVHDTDYSACLVFYYHWGWVITHCIHSLYKIPSNLIFKEIVIQFAIFILHIKTCTCTASHLEVEETEFNPILSVCRHVSSSHRVLGTLFIKSFVEALKFNWKLHSPCL